MSRRAALNHFLVDFFHRDVKELLAGCTDARICTFWRKAPFITRHSYFLQFHWDQGRQTSWRAGKRAR
jgi:hypothetical protein